MAPLPRSPKLLLLLAVAVLMIGGGIHRCAADDHTLDQQIELVWGAAHTYFFMDGDTETLALSLDENMGSCFRSIDQYVFGRIDVDIKLVEGNSAGTVATLYMISEGSWQIHDEIDLEFLGNVTGEPYTLHTNIFANGVGGREEQFRLWFEFDPTTDYHTYTIEWNPKYILIRVDGKVIRSFKNHEDQGLPFPTWQQQRVYGSLWNAEDWATQGGRIKTDWTQAPFFAYYRNYNVTWCQPSPGVSWCGAEPKDSTRFDLKPQDVADLQWVRATYRTYDYCTDTRRYNATEFPKECYMD